MKKDNLHTISVLVANKPGVLVRCAQVFARRAFNIDSLVVSPAVNEKYSRMTITAQGDPAVLDQIIKQTSKLVDVLHCSEHTGADSITKEMALFKVKTQTPLKASALLKLIKNEAYIADDSQKESMIIGKHGNSDELDAFEAILKKEFGIIEMVRSGKLVIAKGLEET